MKLDFKQFHKIECDGKCTTLQHPSGHIIKIAHKGLSDEHKKELDDLPMMMAKGGYAKFSQKYDPNLEGSKATTLPKLPGYKSNSQGKIVPVKGSSGSGPSKSSNNMPGSPTDAKQAFTEPDDQGTDVVLAALNRQAPPFGPTTAKYHSPPCINPSCKSYGKPHPNCRCYGGKLDVGRGGMMNQARYAEGGEVKSYCDMKMPHQKGCAYYNEGTGEVKKEDEVAPEPTPASMIPSPEPSASPTPVDYNFDPQPSPTPADIHSGVDDTQAQSQSLPLDHNGDPDVPVNDGSTVTADRDVNSVSPDASSQVGQDNYQSGSVDPAEVAVNTKQALDGEIQKVQADMNNGVINPKTYADLVADKGFFGKMGTLFGMMLSGAGAGLAHQTPMLMDMMDKQIQRDIDAQQKTQENKLNIRKVANDTLHQLAQTTGLNINNAMTQTAFKQSLMSRATLHSFAATVKNLPEGPQKQKAQQTLMLLGKAIDQKDSDAFTKIAIANATSQNTFGNNSNGQPNTTFMKSFGTPEQQKYAADVEDKTISGVPSVAGQIAARPIPQEKRDKINHMNILDSKMNDLINYSEGHLGTLNLSDRATAMQKAMEAVGFYSSSLGTSMTEGTRAWLDKQLADKNPTSIVGNIKGNMAKLKEIQNSNLMRRDQELKGLGFNTKSQNQNNGSNQSQQYNTNQQKQQTQHLSKSGRPIYYKSGKAYYQ